MITIKNLHVTVEGKEVLKGLDLEIKGGEIHALMGPNGVGKSTLSKVIAGHPSYEVTQGEILYNGKDLFALSVEERAREGIFLAFQNPVEIPGVANLYFLRHAYNQKLKAKGKEEIAPSDFLKLVREKISALGLSSDFLKRDLNSGFSGGEKKQNEMLQMALLEPDLFLLDEIDSGLDVDALKLVAQGVNTLMNEQKAVLLITHYQRLLDYIEPTFIHILFEGKIVLSGGAELAPMIEEQGYQHLVQKRVS